MALLLSDVITAARDRHAAFEIRRVPNAVLARFLTAYQRELVSRALKRNRTFLAQVANVIFDIDPTNAPGTAGVNTAGGLPTDIASSSAVSQSQSPTGTLVEADTDNAQIAYGEKPVTSATSTTLVYTPAAWVVNEHFNRWVVIAAGKGLGQKRYIASNTANVLTTTQAWTITPDATSTFKIVYALLEADDLGVVASYPFTSSETGYLVRLDASGIPFIDLTKPLAANFEVGVPLPPHHLLIGGQVRFAAERPPVTCPLELVGYAGRFSARSAYSAHEMSGKLFLNGTDVDWQDVLSIELRYVPIPPALTALTDFLLLPDTAFMTLVAGCALTCGLRVNGLPEVPEIDLSALAAQKTQAEETWLDELSLSRRNRMSFMREA